VDVAKAELSAWEESIPVGTKIGQYTKNESAYSAAMDELEAAANADEIMDALDKCKAAYVMNMLEVGKYYRIKNTMHSTYTGLDGYTCNMKNFAEITNMNQFALTQQGYYPPVQQAPPIQQQVEKPTKRKQLAKEEPRKEVEGYGNTALENTIIRWDVQSRPAGADVFWRVVSKTPEVKSTNNKYLQTTPYEATKSLDIRGLSYENSGDVRIILRCEKEGYYPQEKEFNVRMIIDQEEISAFFRLVKEE
jgi:hypothetical protein